MTSAGRGPNEYPDYIWRPKWIPGFHLGRLGWFMAVVYNRLVLGIEKYHDFINKKYPSFQQKMNLTIKYRRFYKKIAKSQVVTWLISRPVIGSNHLVMRNKKSRDYECIKIPGFLNESWDIPAGFFPLFLCDILSEMLLNFHVSSKIWLYIQMKFPYFVMKTSLLLSLLDILNDR